MKYTVELSNSVSDVHVQLHQIEAMSVEHAGHLAILFMHRPQLWSVEEVEQSPPPRYYVYSKRQLHTPMCYHPTREAAAEWAKGTLDQWAVAQGRNGPIVDQSVT